MRRVIVESPYAGDVDRHTIYARMCVRDCLSRGEAPLASHLLFTQPGILDDGKSDERKLGIEAGLAWHPVCDAVVVYLDHGVSSGMIVAIDRAKANGIPVEERRLFDPADVVLPKGRDAA